MSLVAKLAQCFKIPVHNFCSKHNGRSSFRVWKSCLFHGADKSERGRRILPNEYWRTARSEFIWVIQRRKTAAGSCFYLCNGYRCHCFGRTDGKPWWRNNTKSPWAFIYTKSRGENSHYFWTPPFLACRNCRPICIYAQRENWKNMGCGGGCLPFARCAARIRFTQHTKCAFPYKENSCKVWCKRADVSKPLYLLRKAGNYPWFEFSLYMGRRRSDYWNCRCERFRENNIF